MASKVMQNHFDNACRTDHHDLSPQKNHPRLGLVKVIRPPAYMDAIDSDMSSVDDEENEAQVEHNIVFTPSETRGSASEVGKVQCLSDNTVKNSNAHSILRSCALYVASIFAYYAVGVLFYRYVEGWSTIDCIYFTTVSMTTVGYGDVTPSTSAGRLFTMLYILVGLVYVMGVIVDAIQQVMDSLYWAVIYQDGLSAQTLRFRRILLAASMAVVVIAVGAVFICLNEDWSAVQGVYWAIMTTTAVGYGDLATRKLSTRMFNVAYVLASVVIVAYAIHTNNEILRERRQEERQRAMLTRPLTAEFLMTYASLDGGQLDRLQFLIAMLEHTSNLDRGKEIMPWLQRFDELDVDGSGVLDQTDLEIFAVQEEFRRKQKLKKLQDRLGNSTVTAVVLQRAHSLRSMVSREDSFSPSEVGELGRHFTSQSDLPNRRNRISKRPTEIENELALLLRRYKRKYGAQHPRTLCALHNMGVAYYNHQDYTLALHCFELAHQGRTVVLGPHDANTIDSLFNLATTYSRLNKCEEAIRHLDVCLRAREGLYGAKHDEAIAVVNNMAWAYAQLEEEELALGLYEYVWQWHHQRHAKRVRADALHAAQIEHNTTTANFSPAALDEQETKPPLLRTLTRDTIFMDNTRGEVDEMGREWGNNSRDCAVNELRARFNMALCYVEFGHSDIGLSHLQVCKTTCMQLFGVHHRASARVNRCLQDAENRCAFSKSKCRVMSKFYSNESLLRRDEAIAVARLQTHGATNRAGSVGSGGVIKNPDKWIDEAIHDQCQTRIDSFYSV